MIKLLMLCIPLLSVAPLFMPWRRWFGASVTVFQFAVAVLFFAAGQELEHASSGEGPSALGLSVYIGVVFFLFSCAIALKCLILLVQCALKRQRKRGTEQGSHP